MHWTLLDQWQELEHLSDVASSAATQSQLLSSQRNNLLLELDPNGTLISHYIFQKCFPSVTFSTFLSTLWKISSIARSMTAALNFVRSVTRFRAFISCCIIGCDSERWSAVTNFKSVFHRSLLVFVFPPSAKISSIAHSMTAALNLVRSVTWARALCLWFRTSILA